MKAKPGMIEVHRPTMTTAHVLTDQRGRAWLDDLAGVGNVAPEEAWRAVCRVQGVPAPSYAGIAVFVDECPCATAVEPARRRWWLPRRRR